MAAVFDPVMALVAFVSFVVGYGCARLGKKEDYATNVRQHQPKNSGGYMRLGGDEEPPRNSQATGEVIPEKQSKFDSLFGSYSQENRQEQRKYEGYEAPERETRRAPKISNNILEAVQKRYSSQYLEVTPEKHEEQAQAKTPEPPREQKKEQKEWTPMGFFED